MSEMDDFGPSGVELWQSVHEVSLVPARAKSLLVNACRIADRLDDMFDAMRVEPLTVMSAKGERIANPLMTEHRMQTLALRQLLADIAKWPAKTSNKKSLAEQLAEMREGA